MSLLAKLASLVGALMFLGIVVVICGAVIQYMTWNPPMKNPNGADRDGLNESTHFQDKEKGARVAAGGAR